MNKPTISSRLACWLLVMHEFDVKIIEKLVQANVVPNFLSQLQVLDDLATIHVSFFDEHLFWIKSFNPWYAYIENYLATRRTPPHFSPTRHRLLVKKSFNFSWIARFMFYIGLDQFTCKCVHEDKNYEILQACHDKPYGGHFTPKRTSYKILNTWYYWPSLHKEVVKHTKHSNWC